MEAKKTEISERGELIKELNALLGKLYYVSEENSLKHREHFIKKQGRDQVDIIIFNREYIKIEENFIKWDDQRAVVAVIDTKRLGENIEKDEHIGKLYRYMLDLNTRFGFITNYREIVGHHLTNKRLRRNASFISIKEVASWMVDCIKEAVSYLPTPLPINRIMEVIETSMNQLMAFAKQVDVKVWEDILKIEELEDETLYKGENEKNDARYRGAAFVSLAQLLFYIVLRTSRIEKERNIKPELHDFLNTNGIPSQIQEFLNVIEEEINFKDIYKFKVFPRFPDISKDALKTMIESLEGLSKELVIQHDLVGLLFQRLIPFDLRKKLAAYYTKPLAGELLSRLIIESGKETVIDPACGSGTLLVQSYLQKKRLLGAKAQHQDLLKDIIGSDISVFATILASVNLAIQDPDLWTNKVNIFNENAFNLPIIYIEKYIDGFIKKFKKQTLNGTKIIEHKGLKTDIVIMNPPFTRGSRLTENERKILLQVSKRYNLKHGWRDWNLYASFILLAPEFLKTKKKGRIGMVLPRAAIYTKYMELVWKKLFESTNFGLKYIISASMTEISFSDSGEQEMLVILENNYDGPATLILMKEELENCDLEELTKSIIQIEKMQFSTNYFEGQKIDQTAIKNSSCREWKFSSSGLLELFQREFVKIDQLDFVIAGGENGSKPVEYFWVPNKYWELDNDTADILTLRKTLEVDKLLRKEFPKDFDKISAKIPEKINIPQKYLVKSLVRKIQDIQDQPPYLSNNFPYLYFLHYREFSKHIDEDYFRWGEIFRKTVPNWVFAPPRLASIFILYRIGLISNKIISLRTSEPVESSGMVRCIFISKDKKQETQVNMDILYAYLTSSIFLLDYIKKSRVAAGAFRRLNSTDLRTLMKFPNIQILSEEQKKMVYAASNAHNKCIPIENLPKFPEIVTKARKNDPNSTLRKLDEVWFKILNIPLVTLDSLYDEILNEFNKYKEPTK